MEEPHAALDVPQVTFKKRSAKSKSTIRKRLATPPTDDDSDSPFTPSEDEEGRQIKRRRKNAGVIASSSEHSKPQRVTTDLPSASAVTAPTNKDDATKTANWYDEDSDKRQEKQTRKPTDLEAPDGTYKGAANYQSFIQKNPDRALKQVGPVKSSSNVRTITVTDFAPDVCKDYKQTGFCVSETIVSFFTQESLINKAGNWIESGKSTLKARNYPAKLSPPPVEAVHQP